MTIFKKTLNFFIIFTLLLITVPFCTLAALVSFSDHCTSLLASDYSTTPEKYAGFNSSIHSLTGFYRTIDGSNITLSQSSANGEVQNSVIVRFWYDGAADEQGLFRVQGSIEFPKDTSTYFLVENSTGRWEAADAMGLESVPNVQDSTSSKLKGIWSEASGELCMVRSGYHCSKQGNVLELPALLKLYNLKNSSSLTSLISGTFESLVNTNTDRDYFVPFSMSLLPSINYQYTFASNKSHESSSDRSDASLSSLKIGRFCSVISNLVLDRQYELQYPSHCLNMDFPKKCSPLSVSYLPAIVSLKNIECLEDEQKMRVLVDFSGSNRWNQRPFNPSVTLVGEGSWDATKNQVIIVACRFLNATDSLTTSHLGGCSVRLSFWFPTKWTIGNTSSIQGTIWSNQTTAELDYFENITFESGQSDVLRFTLPGQEYEYTRTDQVTKLCQRTKTTNDNSRNSYLHPFSIAMRFHHSVVNSTGEEIGWGVAVPLSVGNIFFYPWSYSIEDGTQEYPLGTESPPVSYKYNQGIPQNISYRIDIKAKGEVQLPNGFYILNSYHEMVISAEGIYDDTEGRVCMVGCRDLSTNRHQQPANDSIDCEIVVNFKFPATYPKTSHRSFINGSIISTRNKSDPLYFELVELTSHVSYAYEAEQSIWRMDVEIILVVISNTLACVFGALQLFHVKRHPEVLPSISTCMLNILGLGYLFPLALNFDSMLTPQSSQTLLLGSNGWHEFNALVLNVLTMVGLLIHLRILQLARSARAENGNINELWAVEKLALLVALPVYVAESFVLLLLMNWRKRDYIIEMILRFQGHDIFFTVLKTCAGLVLDGFLLPQVVLNIFRKSKENSLAVMFFVGTTFVRVLPHAYDLFRAHTSAHDQLNESYIYASPAAYFYSTSWNVIVPCGGLLFAVIIYLQQRFGGRCILPHKMGDFGVYEKVTIASVAS